MAQQQQQQPRTGTADNAEAVELPTFDHIMQTASHLPPVTLQSQQKDEYFGKIIDFLAFQKLPADRQEARRIVLIAEHFQIVDNQLVKIAQFQRKRREKYQPLVKVLCLPQEWRLPVLASFHDFSCHASVEKSYYTIREKFFWRNLYADLTNYVLSCPACQLLRCRKRKPIRSGTFPVPKPYEVTNVDHLGPISPSWKGYTYILTMSDNASQYMEAVPVRTVSAEETAQCIYEKYYLRHGFVPNLVSDRAQSFLANLTQELFKICKIRSIQTSSFHPQLNAAAEVKNKTLNLGLKVHLLQGRTDWPRKVPEIVFAHNISCIPSIGTSPFVLTFNRTPTFGSGRPAFAGGKTVSSATLRGIISRTL
jgi:hypothetical protein